MERVLPGLRGTMRVVVTGVATKVVAEEDWGALLVGSDIHSS